MASTRGAPLTRTQPAASPVVGGSGSGGSVGVSTSGEGKEDIALKEAKGAAISFATSVSQHVVHSHVCDLAQLLLRAGMLVPVPRNTMLVALNVAYRLLSVWPVRDLRPGCKPTACCLRVMRAAAAAYMRCSTVPHSTKMQH